MAAREDGDVERNSRGILDVHPLALVHGLNGREQGKRQKKERWVECHSKRVPAEAKVSCFSGAPGFPPDLGCLKSGVDGDVGLGRMMGNSRYSPRGLAAVPKISKWIVCHSGGDRTSLKGRTSIVKG